MRPGFTDVSRLKRSAKRTVEDDRFNLERWWSKKYSRPPNDPLFLEKSEAYWLRDMFTDVYDRKTDLEEQLASDTLKFEERRSISTKLRAIYKALGEHDETVGEDSLIDKWERELDAGITPDLNEGSA